jgi:ribosomal biogenesis protein LAS1
VRDRPSWFPPGKSLQLPYPLLEIRHRIVHRHLPSLAELKRAAQDSLDWLWEWYWSQLDHAFGLTNPAANDTEIEGTEATREKLQAILKAYVKERKSEIKTRKKDSRAAATAVSTYTLRYAPSSTSIPPARTQKAFLELLINDKMILPTDKKIGSSMSGAFLIWDPILLAFYHAGIVSVSTILTHLTSAMNTSRNSMVSVDMDPIKEGLYEWIVHVLRSETYQATGLIEDALTTCFSDPTYWNVRIAEALVQHAGVRDREAWSAVLKAAKDEGVDMDVDVDVDENADANMEQGGPVQEEEKKEKVGGPVKVIGMWKPRPIGWMAEGEGDDW